MRFGSLRYEIFYNTAAKTLCGIGCCFLIICAEPDKDVTAWEREMTSNCQNYQKTNEKVRQQKRHKLSCDAKNEKNVSKPAQNLWREVGQ